MQGRRKNAKVIIAVDDPALIRRLVKIFNGGAFDLETARACADVADKAVTFQTDVILIDIFLPGMESCELVKKLKGRQETSAIAIVLMTEDVADSNMEKWLDAGADDFIVKSAERLELLTRVRTLVKLKRLVDQARSRKENVPDYFEKADISHNGKRTILIVEDDTKLANRYGLMLKSKGYNTLLSKNGAAALNVVEQFTPDLVMMDLSLPDIDGFELLKRLKTSPLMEDVPIIINSIIARPETRVVAIDSGADDYLVKPVNTREMFARINSALHRSESRKKLSADRENLFEQSIIDPLTGLYNRRYLKNIVENDIAAAKRYNRMFYLMMLDIDNFKNINDTFGHLVGDGVLKELGSILRTRLRSSDIASRFGGEEFVVHLTNNTLEGVYVFAERIRQIIEKHPFPDIGGKNITVSIGVTEFRDGDTSMESIIKRVDDALYAAKKEGKNRVK